MTTIVPTTASAARAPLLRRAIESIRRSSAQTIRIIVVVNGERFDPEVCIWLKSQPDVRFEYEPTPSAPNAVAKARLLVRTPYFSTLDDDDEYLDGSTDRKLAVLAMRPDADLVISCGCRAASGELAMAHVAEVPQRPLATLFDSVWLASGNALFRSSTVTQNYFSDHSRFAEWTWLAFKLALDGKRIVALAEPTLLIHDTPGSVSKSDAYIDAYLGLFRRMLDTGPPPEIAGLIRRRMSATWHDQSARALDCGRHWQAFTCHLRSLALPGGLRYLSYTRRLLPGWPKS